MPGFIFECQYSVRKITLWICLPCDFLIESQLKQALQKSYFPKCSKHVWYLSSILLANLKKKHGLGDTSLWNSLTFIGPFTVRRVQWVIFRCYQPFHRIYIGSTFVYNVYKRYPHSHTECLQAETLEVGEGMNNYTTLVDVITFLCSNTDVGIPSLIMFRAIWKSFGHLQRSSSPSRLELGLLCCDWEPRISRLNTAARCLSGF